MSRLTKRPAGLIDVGKVERILLHRYQGQDGRRKVRAEDLCLGDLCALRVCSLGIQAVTFTGGLWNVNGILVASMGHTVRPARPAL
jgi:hypothetical protein